jgi:hypothetical protein
MRSAVFVIVVLASCAGRGDLVRPSAPAPRVERASGVEPGPPPSAVVVAAPTPPSPGRAEARGAACDASPADALAPEGLAGGCGASAHSSSSLMTELQ